MGEITVPPISALMNAKLRVALVACLGGVAIGATIARSSHSPTLEPVPGISSELTQAQWQRLSALKVFFAHQSVGANIIQGVQELVADFGGAPVRIVRGSRPDTVDGPAIVETLIGTNGDPSSKASAFFAAMEHGMGSGGGVALYKYCYLDITASTNVQAVFENHRGTVDRLRAAWPEIVIVHVTVPLTSSEPSARAIVKRLLGKPGVREANAKRNEFNALVRATYASRDPIFDLATIESTRPDGTRSFETVRGDTIYTLAPEFTDDGGHLNRLGRRVAAVRLLQLLGTL